MVALLNAHKKILYIYIAIKLRVRKIRYMYDNFKMYVKICSIIYFFFFYFPKNINLIKSVSAGYSSKFYLNGSETLVFSDIKKY